MNKLAKARARSQGFTLVELMIAMIAGTVTITAAYYLGSASSRNFNHQMRVTETQSSIRSAMDQIRRDVTRAGFLATPEVNLEQQCAGSASAPGAYVSVLRGVSAIKDGSEGLAGKAALEDLVGVDVRLDSLMLLGNFGDGDMYKITGDSDGQILNFETTRESFRRSFFLPPDTFNQTHYNEVFRVGRMVRIDSDRHVFFRQIVNRSDAAASITLDQPIPAGCFKPATALVTPLSFIGYSVGILNGADFSRLNSANSSRPGSSNKAVLMRQEFDFGGGAAGTGWGAFVARSGRMVLDFATEFEINYLVPGTDPGTWTLRAPAEQLQAFPTQADIPTTLRITLSARSEDVNPNEATPTQPREADHLQYPLDSNPLKGTPVKVGNTYARGHVRTLRQEFFLPNMRF
jgi:prepilin-type N-terminal cleavage/methylation domain-containing protein